MSTLAVAPALGGPAAPMRRYVPAAVVLTLVLYGAGIAFLLVPKAESGGGGQVVGRMTIGLAGAGGTAVPETPSAQEAETSEQVTPSEPEKVIAQPPQPAVPPAKPAPRRVVETPKPAPPMPKKAAATPPAPAKPTPAPASAAQVSAPSAPAGAPSPAASPTIGEGAPSRTVGLGASADKAGTAHDAYLAIIRARIEANRNYPTAARRAGAEGTVLLRIRIDGSGALGDVTVLRGTGYFRLDRAAAGMVEDAAPFPAPPKTPFVAEVPVAFSIR